MAIIQVSLPISYSATQQELSMAHMKPVRESLDKRYSEFYKNQQDALNAIDDCVNKGMSLVSSHVVTLRDATNIVYLFHGNREPDWGKATLDELREVWDDMMHEMSQVSRAIAVKENRINAMVDAVDTLIANADGDLLDEIFDSIGE